MTKFIEFQREPIDLWEAGGSHLSKLGHPFSSLVAVEEG